MQITKVILHLTLHRWLACLILAGLSSSTCFPTSGSEQEPQKQRSPKLPFVLRSLPASVTDRQERAEICNQSGVNHHREGEDEAAIDYFRQALLELGDDNRNSLQAAKILTNEALAHTTLGQEQAARACLTEITQILATTKGRDLERSIMLNAAGKVELTLGDPLKAEVLFSRALALREQETDKQEQNSFSPLLNLGAAQLALGQFEKSRMNLLRALTLARTVWGERSEQALAALISLVTVDQELGMLQNARIELEEATKTSEQLFGPFHERTQVLKDWQIPSLTGQTMGEGK